MNEIQPLSIVALVEEIALPALRRGQVGTVVDVLAENLYDVEFSDDEGATYAIATLRGDQLMQLHYEPVIQAA